jgi:hypothetical protein
MTTNYLRYKIVIKKYIFLKKTKLTGFKKLKYKININQFFKPNKIVNQLKPLTTKNHYGLKPWILVTC